MLRAGGNAFDAAVAAAFSSTVVEPPMASLGGGGFLLARTASGEEILFDFFAAAPGQGHPCLPSAEERDFNALDIYFGDVPQEFIIGLASAAVPGTLKGLVHIHRRLGRLPLREVVAPAVEHARAGFHITRFLAGVFRMMEAVYRASGIAVSLHVEAGEISPVGALHRNPALADFLEDLPRDPDGFYAGELAEAIEREMIEGGGLITRTDLARYRVIERRPLEVCYRGRRVLTNPPPSLGGSLLGLGLLLREEGGTPGRPWGSREHVRRTARSLERTVQLKQGQALPGNALQERLLAGGQGTGFRALKGTTHLNASDAEGNVASLSMSNGSGSAYYVPGTGIHVNNMMGEGDLHPSGYYSGQPGERASSMMSPSILLEGDRVLAALGTGGSNRIPAAVFQVASGLLDYGLSADDASNFPRMHFDGTQLHLEPGFPAEAVSALEEEWDIVRWDGPHIYFGGVYVVAPGAGEVGADHRREGHGMIVE